MKRTLRVLNVEDSERDMALLTLHLSRAGYEISAERVETREAMRAALESREWDVILCDYSMPQFDALQAVALRNEMGLDIPLIIISGTVGEEIAVEVMRAGAQDYLMKDNLMRLAPAIERELHETANRRARRQAEEEKAQLISEIEQQRRRLNNIVASVPGIVWEVSSRPDSTDQQVEFVSDYIETMLGYSAEEWLSTPALWKSIVHPADQERVTREVAEIFASGASSGRQEFRWVARNGREYWGESHVAIISDPDGKPLGMRGVTIDISERKLLEEQFRQAQKMEAVGQLAGGIAHDFNNLLTAISGYSQLALRALGAEDPLRRYIEEVKKAGDRAAALTRQLLAFSRKQVLQPKVLDLNFIVLDLEKMLRRLIGENIELSTVLNPDLGSIKIDPGQMEQVIMNLVVNARDAMPEGGKLLIETENVYLSDNYTKQHIGVSPGPYVMLAISDTGMGMEEETQEHIFEPFFTTKELGKGTGLGLSTVYGIIKQSEGSIWVYSEVGEGTTFKIYLPRVDEGAQHYTKSLETDANLHGSETILLAEDEEIVRNLAREVLESYGYHVLEAANGGSALLICEQYKETIHLLLTDVIMPEMSGHTLVERLAGLRPQMKVLYMSGYTDSGMAQRGVMAEGAHFIQKPFSPRDLMRKIREVLNEPDASV